MKNKLHQSSKKVGLLSVTKAAHILGISPDTLRNWDEQGKIKTKRTKGGARRYSLDQLNKIKKEIHPDKKRIGFLTVTRAASELKISPDTLRSWESRGFIQGMRTNGGARRFSRAEISRVQKELGVVKKTEYRAEEELKEKLAESKITITEPKVSKAEPKVRRFKFPIIRLLLLTILLLGVLDLGLILDFKKDALNSFVSKITYEQDMSQIISTLEKLQSSLNNLQTKQKDNFLLTKGSSLWEISANYLRELLGQTPSNEEILDLTKQLAKSANISIPEWGIDGVFDHRNLPDGFKLNLDEETKIGVISNYSTQVIRNLSGNLGIGTINPESKVQISGGGLCVGSDIDCNSDNNEEGVIYSSSTATTVYDVAENYPTKDLDLMPGEVVEVDPANAIFVKRSSKSFSPTLLGVISGKPGVLLGGFNGEQFKEEHQVAVALSGRVLVKVAKSSEAIEVGDILTGSSEPGRAMKAQNPGFTIGRALESWHPSDNKDTIMIFVSASFADPQNMLANLELQVKQAQTEEELSLLEEKVNQISNAIKAPKTAENNLDNLVSPEQLVSTASATMADFKVNDSLSSDKILTALDATFSGTFKALGESFLGKTTIAGDLTVDGTFSINNGNTLNAWPILYLQTNFLAESIDIFNGKVIIGKEGDIKANSVMVADFKVVAGRISGTGVIKKGEKAVFIESPAVSESSRILITPTTETTLVLAVSQKQDQKGFTVVSPKIAEEDTKFDWWMVNEAKLLDIN